MDSWVRGGIEVERFEISRKDLLERNTVIVSFVDIGIPGSYADLEKLGEYLGDLKSKSKDPMFEKQ